MEKEIDLFIPELNSMKNYPKKLYYKGNLNLLKKPKISIVGTRHPNNYCKKFTFKIAHELAKRDIIVVSGARITSYNVCYTKLLRFNIC